MNIITLKNKNNIELIKDVILHPLKINKDKTGILVEALRSDWQDIYGPGREFKMQYYSITNGGIARDEDLWHYHLYQEDRFLVVQGEIVVAISDNREGSGTKGKLNLFHMQADKDPYILLVPKETLHAFVVVSRSPAILLNYPTRLYNPKDEGREPHSKAQVRFPDNKLFSWNKVREEFSKRSSSASAQ